MLQCRQTNRQTDNLYKEIHHSLTPEVIISMDQVARYINEVQRVSEIYAHLFDELLQQSGLAEVRGWSLPLMNTLNSLSLSLSLSLLVQFGVSVQVSQLQYHCVGMWLNHGQLHKGWKKGQGPKLHCFGMSPPPNTNTHAVFIASLCLSKCD